MIISLGFFFWFICLCVYFLLSFPFISKYLVISHMMSPWLTGYMDRCFFNIYFFVNFPYFIWFLISNLNLFRFENIFHMMSIFWKFSSLALWSSIWSILDYVPCVLEKTYILLLLSLVFYKCLIKLVVLSCCSRILFPW